MENVPGFTLTWVSGYCRSREGETTRHLFAQSRTLPIKLTFGFSSSTVKSSSPLPAVSIFAGIEALFIGFRGPEALLNLHGCQLDGTWELVAGQQLPKGARDIKIISGGHFIFAAYDTGKGKLLGTGGGTYVLNGSSYTEHVDFGDRISPGVVGRDQQFAVKIDGDTFVQAGTLTNGKPLSEV